MNQLPFTLSLTYQDVTDSSFELYIKLSVMLLRAQPRKIPL